MLNNPDFDPGATLNRWIQGIMMTPFKLVHVPGHKHKAPDALSRRRFLKEENQPEINPDGWVDDIALMVRAEQPKHHVKLIGLAQAVRPEDKELEEILQYLVTLEVPGYQNIKELRKFILKTNKFFVSGTAMYKKRNDGPPQKVLFKESQCQEVIEELHEETGHQGQWAVQQAVQL